MTFRPTTHHHRLGDGTEMTVQARSWGCEVRFPDGRVVTVTAPGYANADGAPAASVSQEIIIHHRRAA